MKYTDIFSRFYTIITDKKFFQDLSEKDAYELMTEWLNNAVSEPYIRKIFNSITLDDKMMDLHYELNNKLDDASDDRFVINIFAQYLKISWMQQKVDNAINTEFAVGTKEEKVILNNYQPNIKRVKDLELKLKKEIRDRGYYNGDYSGGSS